MKPDRLPLGALAVCLALLVASPAPTADKLHALIPANADVVIGVNVRAVAESQAFKDLIERLGPEKIQAQHDAFRNLTGVDIFAGDLERVTIMGRVGGNEGGAILIEGRFDQDRLIGLLKANEGYGTSEAGGHTIHTWIDEKEDEERFGCFVDATTILVAEEMEELTSCLADGPRALDDPEKAKLVPANAATAAAWGVVFDVSRLPNDKDLQALRQLRSISGSLTLGPTSVTLDARAYLASKEQMQTWIDLARGLLALGQLQGENPALAELARHGRIEAGKDGTSVVVGADISYEILRQLHEEGAGERRENRIDERRERRRERRGN